MFIPLTRTLILFLYKSNTWQVKRLHEKPIHLFLPVVSWLETTFCLTFWFVILHLKEMFAHRELLMYHAVKHRAVGSLLQTAIEVLRFLVVETALPVQEETKWSSGKVCACEFVSAQDIFSAVAAVWDLQICIITSSLKLVSSACSLYMSCLLCRGAGFIPLNRKCICELQPFAFTVLFCGF